MTTPEATSTRLLAAPRPYRVVAWCLGLVALSQILTALGAAALVFLAPLLVSPLTLLTSGTLLVLGGIELWLARRAYAGRIDDRTGLVILVGLLFFASHTIGAALSGYELGSGAGWLAAYIFAAAGYVAAELRISISPRGSGPADT